jgi:hypothetical protein
MPENFEATLIQRLFESIKEGVFNEIKPRMMEAMETAFIEAWDAAIQRLSQSPAQPSKAPSPVPAIASQSTGRPRGGQNVASRASWGTSKNLVEDAFEAHPGEGLTATMVAEFGAKKEISIAVSSVRATLLRMQANGHLRKRKAKFYRIVVKPEAPEATEAEAQPSGGATVHPIKGEAA